MIFYRSKGSQFIRNLFQLRGSVFPFAFSIALPVAVACALLEWYSGDDHWMAYSDQDSIMNEPTVWAGFTALVGFLIVFRTSIAYNRFWDGVTATHKMRAEWFDAVSSICAFCRHSKQAPQKIKDFQNTIVRLFSLLHCVALAEIEDSSAYDQFDDANAFRLDLVDDCFIDDESLAAIRDASAKTELAFQWIQQIIVENIRTEILDIPAPILSRAFHELANGMVQFHEALKVSAIPFPFPYAQTCDLLVVVHALLTPLVITIWVNDPWWAFVFSFLQVFIMWSLRAIAVQIENPFGYDANDLEDTMMQTEMNTQLRLLLSHECQRLPQLNTLVDEAMGGIQGQTMMSFAAHSRISQIKGIHRQAGECSLTHAWKGLAAHTPQDEAPVTAAASVVPPIARLQGQMPAAAPVVPPIARLQPGSKGQMPTFQGTFSQQSAYGELIGNASLPNADLLDSSASIAQSDANTASLGEELLDPSQSAAIDRVDRGALLTVVEDTQGEVLMSRKASKGKNWKKERTNKHRNSLEMTRETSQWPIVDPN